MIDVMAYTDGQPIEPLTPAEEGAWRALARAVWVIPAPLGADVLEAHGLSVTEYPVLSSLSEAINQSLTDDGVGQRRVAKSNDRNLWMNPWRGARIKGAPSRG
jgi:hypothetical protein